MGFQFWGGFQFVFFFINLKKKRSIIFLKMISSYMCLKWILAYLQCYSYNLSNVLFFYFRNLIVTKNNFDVSLSVERSLHSNNIISDLLIISYATI